MVVDRRDIAPAGDAVLHLAEEGDGGVGREDQETDSRRKLHGQEIVFTPYKWKLLSPHPRKSQSLSLTSFSLISIGIRTLIISLSIPTFCFDCQCASMVISRLTRGPRFGYNSGRVG